MNPIKKLRIAICNDHAGYELKLKILEYLEGEGAEVKDFGAFSAVDGLNFDIFKNENIEKDLENYPVHLKKVFLDK